MEPKVLDTDDTSTLYQITTVEDMTISVLVGEDRRRVQHDGLAGATADQPLRGRGLRLGTARRLGITEQARRPEG